MSLKKGLCLKIKSSVQGPRAIMKQTYDNQILAELPQDLDIVQVISLLATKP